jgi:hypothetical protein
MIAALCDHDRNAVRSAMSGMMVLLSEGVEWFAKIAMTTLSGWLATTRLLPEHDLQRCNFLNAGGA